MIIIFQILIIGALISLAITILWFLTIWLYAFRKKADGKTEKDESKNYKIKDIK